MTFAIVLLMLMLSGVLACTPFFFLGLRYSPKQWPTLPLAGVVGTLMIAANVAIAPKTVSLIYLVVWLPDPLQVLNESENAALATDLARLVGILIAVIATFVFASLHHGRRGACHPLEPRCLACHYDLTGNISGRCPECGTHTGSPPVSRSAVDAGR